MTADVELLPCGECGMPCRPDEYHPFAACLMFKACRNSATVRGNLQDAQDHFIAPLQAEIEALRVEVAAQRTRADAMAGEAVKHEARAERLASALRLIATSMRPDGTWNRDREACRQIAVEALRDHA